MLSIGGEDTNAGDPAEVVINEDTGDVDFRVESDNLENAFYVEGNTGDIAVGTGTPDAPFHIERDNAATNTVIVLERLSLTSSGTPAANLGPSLEFEVETAAGAPGNQEVIAAIDGIVTDVTSAAEDGAIIFKTMKEGSAATEDMRVAGHEIKTLIPFTQNLYYWHDEFDDAAAADAVDEKGRNADYWTVGGTNEADCANFALGAGGTVELKTVNTGDNDSTFIIGEGTIRVDSNPIVEFRFKVDNIVDAVAMVGLVEGSMTEITAAPDDDVFLVGLQEENGVSADAVIVLSNDNAGGATYQDTLINVVNNTWVIVRFDLTNTEQPRVWVNGAEIAAAQITGTVQAGITVMPYAHVQVLVGGPIQRTMTIDYIKVWQDRG